MPRLPHRVSDVPVIPPRSIMMILQGPSPPPPPPPCQSHQDEEPSPRPVLRVEDFFPVSMPKIRRRGQRSGRTETTLCPFPCPWYCPPDCCCYYCCYCSSNTLEFVEGSHTLPRRDGGRIPSFDRPDGQDLPRKVHWDRHRHVVGVVAERVVPQHRRQDDDDDKDEREDSPRCESWAVV